MYLNKRRINLDVKQSPYVNKNRGSVYNMGGATYIRGNNQFNKPGSLRTPANYQSHRNLNSNKPNIYYQGSSRKFVPRNIGTNAGRRTSNPKAGIRSSSNSQNRNLRSSYAKIEQNNTNNYNRGINNFNNRNNLGISELYNNKSDNIGTNLDNLESTKKALDNINERIRNAEK